MAMPRTKMKRGEKRSEPAARASAAAAEGAASRPAGDLLPRLAGSEIEAAEESDDLVLVQALR